MLTNRKKKQLALELQDTFDSIQMGAYTDALDDLRRICNDLGYPIHDEYQDKDEADND